MWITREKWGGGERERQENTKIKEESDVEEIKEKKEDGDKKPKYAIVNENPFKF